MIDIKDLINAGIEIKERIEGVVTFADIVDVENVDYKSVANGDYGRVDFHDYYGFANRTLYIKDKNFCSVLMPSDFQELIEESCTVEEFIEGAKELSL